MEIAHITSLVSDVRGINYDTRGILYSARITCHVNGDVRVYTPEGFSVPHTFYILPIYLQRYPDVTE